MVSVDLSLLISQSLRLLLGCVILAVLLLVVVGIGRIIRQAIQKRFNLSWSWSVLATSLVIFTILFGIFYFWPSGFQFFNANDSIPASIQPLQETNYDAVPTNPDSNPLLAALFLALFKVLTSAAVFSLLAFPFILIGSIMADYFAPKKPKKNPTLLSYFLACLGCVILLVLLLLAFPWLYAGLAYFVFFS